MLACPNCGEEVPGSFRFCPNCATPLAAEPARAEERKLVTILFADMTGSTAMGERLDPERLRSILNTYFSSMSAAIEAWGGTVEKFIGDAVMAVFGVPVVREDDAERALRAAMDMLERLDALNAEFQGRHGTTIRIRIGVNTGEVIAPMGPTEQLIVAGDAVNVAARLEQAAEPGTVLVGERSYLAARTAFRFEEPVALQLKGKAGTVTARRLIGPLAEAARGVPGLRTAMVGRDRELEALAALLDEAVETRRPRLVVVFGPAGIGKSRLVEELLGQVPRRHPDARLLRGRCLAVGRATTYWALGEILRSVCGIALDDPAEAARAKLGDGTRTALAGLDLRPEEVEQTVFALATTAGIPVPGNPLDRIEPREVAEELARAWPRFASALARRGPAVCVVEDLHWAEAQLLDMLERILARSEGPLLLLATARPEFAEAHPEFVAGREAASSISLRPLTGAQSADLVDGLLATVDLPSELREEMLAKAEGNPFFLEEIIRRLIDGGDLVRVGDRWTATGRARTTLPDTIHGLLAARIDALSPEEKRVLQEAAVVGRVFWEEPVARALGNGRVTTALLGLERKGLVFARPTSTIAGQVEFMFKHALVRDVAYANLPKSRRARAHAELAGWIEDLAGDRLEEFAELLAHHYATAATGEDADLAWEGDPAAGEAVREKAFEALVAAGAVARRRFGIDQAVHLHEQAVALAGSDLARARALEEVGDDHAANYHGDGAVAAYREALTFVRGDPDAGEVVARLCHKAARMAAEKAGAFVALPQPAEIEALVEEGLRAASLPESRAWLLATLGLCSLLWRRESGSDPKPHEDRVRSVQEALAIGERLDDPEIQVFAARTLSELHMVAGESSRSVEAARLQLSLVDRLESAGERALVLFEVASAVMDLAGDFVEGLELARASAAAAEDLSAHERMHASYVTMNALYHLGRWAELLPLLDQHLAGLEGEQDVSCFAVRGGPIVGALALIHLGEVERARELVESWPGDPEKMPGFEGLRARALVALGDHAEGRRLAERIPVSSWSWRAPDAPAALVEAVEGLEEWNELEALLATVREHAGKAVELHPLLDRAEGRAAAAAGHRTRAVELLERAIEGFDALGMVFDAARSCEALGSVTSGEEGRRRLEEALETYRRLGARQHAGRVESVLTQQTPG